MVQKLYGDKAGQVLAAYPAAADGRGAEQAARDLESDRFIALSTWRWMDLATRTGGQPTFYYLFAQPRPALKAAPDAPRPKGAVHSAEIEYVLGNLDLNPIYAWTDEDRAASQPVCRATSPTSSRLATRTALGCRSGRATARAS